MTILPEIHITSETPILPAIKSWEVFLLDQGRSLFTVKAFLGDLNLFARFFAPDITVGSVTSNDINRFLDWMQNERGIPCSPKTLSRRITSIKAFYRWLTQTGRLTSDPSEQVLQKSVMSPLPEVLTPDEEFKLIEAAMTFRTASKPDARPYALVVLLLTTGIKKGETLNLDLNHVDLDDPKGAHIFIRYASGNSRYKERKITLTESWITAYPEYLSQYNPIEKVFPWSPRRLEYILEDLGKAVNLAKHLSFDMCRWTCALDDWQSGMEKDLIRQKLGVSKIQWREISMKLRQLASEQ